MTGEPSPGPSAGQPYQTRDLAAIAARWDARAEDWDTGLKDPGCHLNEDDAYARFLRQTRQTLLEHKSFCATRGVIDVGCGTGLVLADVISHFAWGMGIDVSPGMIHTAAAKAIPRARFLVGDCFALPSLCPPAGAVISRGVLLSHYGARHATSLLAAVRGALVPGGFALMDFLDEAGRERSQHVTKDKTYFTSKVATNLAQEVGFHHVLILGEPGDRVRILLAE